MSVMVTVEDFSVLQRSPDWGDEDEVGKQLKQADEDFEMATAEGKKADIRRLTCIHTLYYRLKLCKISPKCPPKSTQVDEQKLHPSKVTPFL